MRLYLFQDNAILNTDSYKMSQYLQYPPGTQFVSSYIEARKSEEVELMFFGLQRELKRLNDQFITQEQIDFSEKFLAHHVPNCPFNRQGWEDLLELGYWPLEVRALPEGCTVKPGVPMVEIINTDHRFFWLVSYLETRLLRAAWLGVSAATRTRRFKKLLLEMAINTGSPVEGIDFQFVGFGSRGGSCEEAVRVAGGALLTGFKSTDDQVAILDILQYYTEDQDLSRMPGFAIPASEHSTVTPWWNRSGEHRSLGNMFAQFPTGPLAWVSDSFDVVKCVEEYWGELYKDIILSRDGVAIIRPDSGDPVAVLRKLLRIVGEKFGYTTNAKGFKVLNEKVRLIQGDSITEVMIRKIYAMLLEEKWASENISYGCGGHIIQAYNRDDHGFAMKCSAICIHGIWFDVFKEPITAPFKKSKKGRQSAVYDKDGDIVALSYEGKPPENSAMQLVYQDGKFLVDHTIEEIRERVNHSIGITA